MVYTGSKFRRRIVVALLILGSLPVGLWAQGALAYFGNDSIDVAAYDLTYPSFLLESNAADSLPTRLQHLHNLIGERLLIHQGYVSGLDGDPDIRRAAYHAWRDVLADQIGRRLFLQKVSSAEAIISATYRQEQTSLHTRSITFADSLTALTALAALRSGVPFESVALRYSSTALILAEPWDRGWLYPAQLDPDYAKAAAALQPGGLSGSIRTDDGFALIHLLGKNFSPAHGHFGRVRRQEELREIVGEQISLEKVYQELRLWVAAQPVKWSKRRLRKIIKEQYLSASDPLEALTIANPKFADATLFTIDRQPYTFRWLSQNLHLLPPESPFDARELIGLQDVISELLMVMHLLDLVASLPDGQHWLSTAEQTRKEAVDAIVLRKMVRQLMDRAMPSEGTLFELWGNDSSLYYRRTEVDLEELIVADSAAAAVLASQIQAGASLSVLAAKHTGRLWARPLKGRLGWMPADLYRPWSPALADSLASAIAGTVIGPVQIDGHTLFVRVWGLRHPGWLEPGQLFTNLKLRWNEEGKAPLLEAWIARRIRDYYPITVNINLLEILSWPAEDLPPLTHRELEVPGYTDNVDIP